MRMNKRAKERLLIPISWVVRQEKCVAKILTTCTLLCRLPARDAFSGCFLSAFLAAFFALFSRKRFCNTTVSMLCCSHTLLNDWSNRGLHCMWCFRYDPTRFASRSIGMLILDISGGACCWKWTYKIICVDLKRTWLFDWVADIVDHSDYILITITVSISISISMITIKFIR